MEYVRYIMAVVGTALNYLLGGWEAALVALVAFVVLDFITGVLAAFVNKKLDSRLGAKGIVHKVGVFVVVGVANVLDGILGLPDPMLRQMAIWFYIATEGMSILENIGAAGAPIPPVIRQALERLKDEHADV